MPSNENRCVSDDVVRKRWLLATLLNFVAVPLLSLLWVIAFYVFLVFKGIPALVLCREQEFIKLVVATPIFILHAWLMYRFAYKKRGVKWLGFWLVIITLRSFAEICKIFKPGEAVDPVECILLGVGICVFAWWFVLSLKLLKINRKRKWLLSDDATHD